MNSDYYYYYYYYGYDYDDIKTYTFLLTPLISNKREEQQACKRTSILKKYA